METVQNARKNLLAFCVLQGAKIVHILHDNSHIMTVVIFDLFCYNNKNRKNKNRYMFIRTKTYLTYFAKLRNTLRCVDEIKKGIMEQAEKEGSWDSLQKFISNNIVKRRKTTMFKKAGKRFLSTVALVTVFSVISTVTAGSTAGAANTRKVKKVSIKIGKK